MVGRPGVSVVVFRIVFREVDKDTHEAMEKEIDDALIHEFRAKKLDIHDGGMYREVVVQDSEQGDRLPAGDILPESLKGPHVCAELSRVTNVIYPAFLVQFTLMSLAYVFLRLLLRPLRQPQFVCSVLAGFLASPFVVERAKIFAPNSFPHEEILVARTAGFLGTTLLIFLLAVKTDATAIQRSTRNASIIGSSTILMTFAFLSLLIHTLSLPGVHKGFFRCTFAGVLSLTRFPNVVYAFNELNIMTSDLGQLAMSSTMLSEVVLWTWLFIDIYIAHRVQFFWSAMAALGSILVIFFVIRPLIMLIIRRTPESKSVREVYITSIIIGSLIVGGLTDLFGTMHFGVLLVGLVIPNGPPLGSTLSEKIEVVCTEVLMPMFYVSVGYSMDPRLIDMKITREIFLLMFVSALTRVAGALSAAIFCKVRLRHCVLLGLMLNIRGPYDLHLLIRWLVKKDIDRRTFTMLILSDIALTAIVTPLIDCFYNPHTRLIASIRKWAMSTQTTPRNVEMRVLCCVHNGDNVPGIISLIEASNPTAESPICAYVVHLNELVGRSMPIMVPYKKQMTRTQSRSSSHHIMRAFENYCNNSHQLVRVKPYTVIAEYKNMHEYICRLAQEELIPLIVIPFHGSQDTTNIADHVAFRNLRENIRTYAPCTMATLVDKGVHSCTSKVPSISGTVGVIFIGGTDDREALALAIRMVGRPNFGVAVLRLVFSKVDGDMEGKVDEKLDDGLINEYRVKLDVTESHMYREVAVEDAEHAMSNIRAMKDKFNLIMVGQRRRAGSLFSEETMLNWSENPELGVIGDILASSDFCGEMTSVLVMKHHGDTSCNLQNAPTEHEGEDTGDALEKKDDDTLIESRSVLCGGKATNEMRTVEGKM
ncbi:cation/H(+) antiporter 15-like [Rhodamnia argentea]|uniref:Cation/H(+) antiporter 15-like n=1 Tax=Rhodamnia argentea TaxID=178133 RepID=A0A8B8N7Y1_9MYRT|nr:cation/H(+) antiporter 15-like [Rhodamnia argentea]